MTSAGGKESRFKIQKLDEAFADAAEKVFAFGTGLFENLWLTGVFEHDFLHDEFDGVFGLETLRNQFPNAGGKALGSGGGEPGEVIGAGVFAELAQRQAVIGSLGFGSGEQGGNGIVPIAGGAGPALKAGFGGPDYGSGTLRFFVLLVFALTVFTLLVYSACP